MTAGTKRFIFILVFAVILSLTVVTVFAAEPVELPYNGINITRQADCLVIYRESNTTGTNEWGYEVTCDETGTVIAMGGNDCTIPDGGFVVSGHGTMKDFLINNVKMGDVIILDETGGKIIITEDGVYSPFYTKELDFNGVNVARGTDFLVVYNKAGSTTKTNTYGYEVVCDKDGYAILLGGNDNTVPEGGFVLSGHGTAIDTLKNLIQLGSSVAYEEQTRKLTVTYEAANLKKATEIYYGDMKEELEEAKANYRDVMYTEMQSVITRTEKLLADFDTDFADGVTAGVFTKIKEIAALKEEFASYNTESLPVETRGVWLRPQETSLEQVKAVVANIKAAKLNAVYIETYFSGYTICVTRPDDVYAQNPVYNGFDVLQAYIDVCHAEGIQVHLWNTVFNAGGTKEDKISLAAKKPEWLAVNKNGAPEVATEYGNMYFISPANEEAKAYLLDFYSYVLSVYDIDGIQLDYIRYPNSSDNTDYGYNKEVCEDYKSLYGIDPMTIERGDEDWAQWCAYRAQLVTDFVLNIKALINVKRPDILLSADIFPELDSAPTSIMQDGKLWISEGYIDAVFPMSYGDTSVTNHAKAVNAAAGDHCYDFIGTATYQGYSTGTAIALIEDAHEQNCDGFTWFEYKSMVSGGYDKAAITTVLRRDAISQIEGLPAFTAQLDYIAEKVDSIIVPFGGMTEEDAEAFKKQLSDLRAAAGDDLYANRQALEDAIKAIKPVADKNAVKTLNDDLVYALRMVKLAKPAFTATFEPKPEQPVKEQETEASSEAPDVIKDTETDTGTEDIPVHDTDKQPVNPLKENAAMVGIAIGAGVLIAVSAVAALFMRKKKKEKKK